MNDQPYNLWSLLNQSILDDVFDLLGCLSRDELLRVHEVVCDMLDTQPHEIP